MQFNNEKTRNVAEIAAKIMYGEQPVSEELKGGQKKIDKNHNGKIDGQDFAILRGQKKANEEVESIEEVKMADLPSTKVQGRAYGSSKPQPSAFDVLKGPKDKELKSIEAEKKKKKMSEMVSLYKEGGMKAFFESVKKEDLVVEEPDNEQFTKEVEDQKKRAAGTKPQAEVAKAAVQSVQQEEVEQVEERTLTPGETKKKEEIVKSMKKGLAGFKERYGERAKSVMYATATKQAKKD